MHRTTRRLAGVLATGAALAVLPLMAADAATPIHAGSSVFTGTMQPGDSRSYVVNNLAEDRVYRVGLAPSGASTSANCQFEVTRTRDVRQPGGERELHFTVTNVGTIACGTTATTGSLPASHTVSLGAVDVGASTAYSLTTGNHDLSYLAGIDPVGATSSTPCQFEVTSEKYSVTLDGQRFYRVVAKNVGSIACQAYGLIGSDTADTTHLTNPIAAGDTVGLLIGGTKAGLQYFPGFDPGASGCNLAVSRLWYQQRIRDDGVAVRDLRMQITNSGSSSCLANVLLAAIDTA
jgi:hypothetical protein